VTKHAAKAKSRKPVPAYHHGDLREALLHAAARLVERNGVENFTLRESARLAGVSHSAPAHHFATKTDLLDAVARRAAQQRHAQAEAMFEHAGADPLARMEALGLAYIDYAIRHPELHRLMFQPAAQDDGTPSAEVRALGDTLLACVEAALGRKLGQIHDDNPETILPWALVHGFAALVNEGLILRNVPATRRPAAAIALAGQVLALILPLIPQMGAQNEPAQRK
jgi:AcrR family transcriptional regulator